MKDYKVSEERAKGIGKKIDESKKIVRQAFEKFKPSEAEKEIYGTTLNCTAFPTVHFMR